MTYLLYLRLLSLFFFTAPSTTEIYTLSLHDALPIFPLATHANPQAAPRAAKPLPQLVSVPFQAAAWLRSEEHTSELQSQFHLVCRLLLEKKKHITYPRQISAAAAGSTATEG